ncbi:protein-export chaperone SecB [Sphingomonas donggukensis]|uniref:Protein-export protein SecB n=1 Tax=Sphingomonas donggukensis TaxID=2949093 RepID=A0ABY4TT93_9SPHN|nr:protein-export chaperone SecB [Sphingomonas donggukensis]URW74419.1 protein-export chaperone SecB [Sphingomonas donggukensis]
MADENFGAGGEPLANGADTAPVAGVISQYVKDLSFENPNAPAIYQTPGAPKIDVGFNIGAAKVGEDVHEVMLKIDVRAETEDGQAAFVVDLTFGGLFGLRNIPDEHVQPFLLGEAPRILFPFARRIVADAVRDGGFPPLLLDPIDFGQLYMQQLAEQGALAEGEPAGQA